MSRPEPFETSRTGDAVTLLVDGRPVSGEAGGSVASLLLAAGIRTLRRSPRAGTPRGAFCLMGICQECVVRIDGALRQSCLVEARDGATVELGPAA